MAGTPLTDAINALTTYSNTVTGASDTTLSEAVATLAAGYGGGGGGADLSSINLMNGIGMNEGYLDNSGNHHAQSTGGQNEYYTNEIDVSAYRGQNLYVLQSADQQKSQYISICLYDSNHTFRIRTVPVNNTTTRVTVGTFTVGSTDSYARISFRAWDSTAIACVYGLYNFMRDAHATVVTP